MRMSKRVMDRPEIIVPEVESEETSTNNARGNTLTRNGTHYRRACLIIFACEVVERIAFYAISSNLTIYLTTMMQENVADAATNSNNWGGTTLLTPFIGAFVADVFLGRYWTIVGSLIIYFLALVSVTISISVEPFKPHCEYQNNGTLSCANATGAQRACLYVSLYLMALGAGGIKACVTAFSADQFDNNDPQQRREKVSFMNWWWMSISIGIMLSSAIFPWMQQQFGDWVWVGAVPASFVGVVFLAFILAHPLYHHEAPSGSPFTQVFQVFVLAFRNRNLQLPEDPTDLYETGSNGLSSNNENSNSSPSPQFRLEHTPRLRFLDKAAIRRQMTPSTFDASLNTDVNTHSSCCSVTQVEEVKLLLGVLPIWATNLPNSAVFTQVNTFFVSQGTTMDPSLGPHFSVPPASLISTISLSIIIFLPLYDRLFVPMMRKLTGNPRGVTLLQRIGIGIFISTIAVVVAGAVENHRLKVAISHGDTLPVPLSIFWLVPQYFLVGLYEVFIVVGQGEFFYLQAPPGLRSFGTAFLFGNWAVGSFLSSLLVTVVDAITRKLSKKNISWVDNDISKGHLDYFYWLLAVLNLVFFILFLHYAREYKYSQNSSSNYHMRDVSKYTGNSIPISFSSPGSENSFEEELAGTGHSI
ncbi:hypothetical protein R1sor_015758 [Riccia sorocarpa]|uniref:NPF family transporter n=1 Tax=Riccia sorocarpa TaxID=122646 RepID=A0ABD3HJ87_9MARC